MLEICRIDLSDYQIPIFTSADSNLYPSAGVLIFQATWDYLPGFLLNNLQHFPNRESRRFLRTIRVINKVSKRLIEEKREALLTGDKTSRDVMSVLGKFF